jgi:hypothetical protein
MGCSTPHRFRSPCNETVQTKSTIALTFNLTGDAITSRIQNLGTIFVISGTQRPAHAVKRSNTESEAVTFLAMTLCIVLQILPEMACQRVLLIRRLFAPVIGQWIAERWLSRSRLRSGVNHHLRPVTGDFSLARPRCFALFEGVAAQNQTRSVIRNYESVSVLRETFATRELDL